MTTKETLKQLKAAGKTVGLTQLYKYFDACGIKPIGARQRPQIYPNDSAERILNHLGIETERQASTSEFLGLKPYLARKILSLRREAARKQTGKNKNSKRI